MVDMVRKSRFLGLVEQNQDIVHKICGLYAVNTDERKYLSQEIVCRLWKSYKSFRGDSKFSTWMWIGTVSTLLLIFALNTLVDNDQGTYRINRPVFFIVVSFLVLLFIYGAQKIAQFFAVR